MRSVNANRLSRKKRGVSPIIATILLVAITVVLAAVLYILVTGLIGGGSKTANTIGLGPVQAGSCKDGGGVTWDTYTFAVASTSGTITTSQFGMGIQDANKNTITTGTLATGTGSCIVLPSAATTLTGKGWVAALENTGAGTVADSWPSASGAWANGGITVTSSTELVIVVSHGSTMTGDQLSAFALGSNGGITFSGGAF